MSDSEEVRLYNPHSTDVCSEPLYRFITEYDKLIGYFFFVVRLTSHVDHVREVATRTLAKVDNKTVDEIELTEKTALKGLQRYAAVNSRSLTVSMVDNFLCYVSEIVQLVMSKKVEVLRSSERITLEEIFQFSTFQALASYIVDKKISELSYGGLRQMEEFMRDRLGIEVFANNEQRALLTIFVELRNVHTHNRGIINDLFLTRTAKHTHPKFKFAHGKFYGLDFDEFSDLSRNAIEVALEVDRKLSEKFRIRRSKYKKRLQKERSKKGPDTATSLKKSRQTKAVKNTAAP